MRTLALAVVRSALDRVGLAATEDLGLASVDGSEIVLIAATADELLDLTALDAPPALS